MDPIKIARDAILDDLARRHKEGDKTVWPAGDDNLYRWYKPQKNYFSGSGKMPCPICKTGELRYSRAQYNGHVHARCMAGCVAWME